VTLRNRMTSASTMVISLRSKTFASALSSICLFNSSRPSVRIRPINQIDYGFAVGLPFTRQPFQRLPEDASISISRLSLLVLTLLSVARAHHSQD
jgi:hypothetical protein